MGRDGTNQFFYIFKSTAHFECQSKSDGTNQDRSEKSKVVPNFETFPGKPLF